MDYVNIDLLEEGSVVARDVRSSSNMLLLPAGTALKANQINMLKTWGINRIFIDTNEDTESPEYLANEKILDEKIEELFIHNDNHAFINSLKVAIRRFHRRKLKEQQK